MQSNHRPNLSVTVLTTLYALVSGLSLTGCASIPNMVPPGEQLLLTLSNLPGAVRIVAVAIAGLAALQLLTLAYNTFARWQIARHTRGLRVLTEAMPLAHRSFDLEKAVGEPLALILKHMQVPVGVVHLLDPIQHRLALVCACGLGDSAREALSDLAQDDTVMGEAIRSGAPVKTAGPANAAYLRALSGAQARVCAISVPLVSGRRNIGAMTLAAPRYRAFTDDEVSLLAGLGNHLGVVVENLRMVDAMRAQMAQLDAALVDLRAAEKARDDLLASVSRDLRAPLIQVRGYVGILLDGELSNSLREGLEMVQSRVEHTLDLLGERLASDPAAQRIATAPLSSDAAEPRALSASCPPVESALPATDMLREGAITAASVSSVLTAPDPQVAPAAPDPHVERDWRMNAPVEASARRPNWLVERLARLDRLQRIALGAGVALLVLFVTLLIVVSLWQQAHW